MNPVTNNNQNGFLSTSIANMNNYLGGEKCPLSTTTTPTLTPLFFKLKSTLSTWSQSWCLDLTSSDTTNGTPIWLWPCNGGNVQQWTKDSEGYICSQIDTNKCVVTSGANLNAGTHFMIWDCISKYPAMQWLKYTDSSFAPGTPQTSAWMSGEREWHVKVLPSSCTTASMVGMIMVGLSCFRALLFLARKIFQGSEIYSSFLFCVYL
jgi:hypothetical protein